MLGIITTPEIKKNQENKETSGEYCGLLKKNVSSHDLQMKIYANLDILHLSWYRMIICMAIHMAIINCRTHIGG